MNGQGIRMYGGGEPGATPPLAPGLYVVATPIGNLRDITLRALDTLAACDLLLCEDTRVSLKLLARYGIRAPIKPYHEHNAERMRPVVLDRLQKGEAVALISDAGTPLLSDPGYKLVRAAIEKGVRVFPVPGPSALTAALSVAGLPTDRFFFAGFLPPREQARKKAIAALKDVPGTLVFFEAPQRLAGALAAL